MFRNKHGRTFLGEDVRGRTAKKCPMQLAYLYLGDVAKSGGADFL